MSRTRKPRPRMFVPGDVLSLDEVVAEIMSGRYVIWRDKSMHPGWVRSLQLGYLLHEVWGNRFRKALPNPEWKGHR